MVIAMLKNSTEREIYSVKFCTVNNFFEKKHWATASPENLATVSWNTFIFKKLLIATRKNQTTAFQ